MSLSDNLRKLRNSLGLTQEQVSTDLKMNRATYAHYETGRREPDIEMLKLLSKYYKVTTDYLLEANVIEPCILSVEEPEKEYDIDDRIPEQIRDLSPESQRDLEDYIKLLKLRDMQKRNAEFSDELTTLD